MEKNLCFDIASVQQLIVKLAWAQLEIIGDDVEDIQVLAAGDEHTVSELRVFQKENRLVIEQPQYGISMNITNGKWMQVCIRVPKAWKGAVDANTISGLLNIRGVSGGDITLDTVSGDLRAMDIAAISLSLRTVSGDILGGGIKGDKLNLRTISGNVNLMSMAFLQVRSNAVSGRQQMEFVQPFDRVDITAVSGDVTLHVPMDKLETLLRSVSGRIRTSGVSLVQDAPSVHITGVSADLEVVCTCSQEN